MLWNQEHINATIDINIVMGQISQWQRKLNLSEIIVQRPVETSSIPAKACNILSDYSHAT